MWSLSDFKSSLGYGRVLRQKRIGMARRRLIQEVLGLVPELVHRLEVDSYGGVGQSLAALASNTHDVTQNTKDLVQIQFNNLVPVSVVDRKPTSCCILGISHLRGTLRTSTHFSVHHKPWNKTPRELIRE